MKEVVIGQLTGSCFRTEKYDYIMFKLGSAVSYKGSETRLLRGETHVDR